MKYRVELEQFVYRTTHFHIEVEVEAETAEDAVGAAFEKAERQDLPYRRRKPTLGEWRKSHDHNLKSIEVLEVVSQPS